MTHLTIRLLFSYLKLLRVFFQTVLKTVYWQKYGLDPTLRLPLYNLEKLSSLSAKEIYNEISKGADEFLRVSKFDLKQFLKC